MMELSGEFDLPDDPSVREKLPFMYKWEAMMDDGRNPAWDWADRLEEVLEVGKRYRVTIRVEEIGPCTEQGC